MDRLKKMFVFVSERFFEKFFTAWMLSSAVIISVGTGDFAPDSVPLSTFLAVFVGAFVFVCALAGRKSSFLPVFLMFSVLMFSTALLIYSNTIYTYLATAVLFVLSVWHMFNKNGENQLNVSNKAGIVMLVCSVLVFFCVLTAFSVLRYKTFSAPNYDFGIFCNMFHNMRESFRPLVSCERDKILSHFAVHFSPAMYVFLPIYYIFPSPITVAVCQTVAIYSGIIPFILIMKHRKLDTMTQVLFAVVYAANAAYTGGCVYDFHENCLLVPFMMWMFFFYEKKKIPLMFLFALFTLMVKEDAFVYVSVFAVYIILSEKKFIKGASLLFTALAYFAVACYILEQHGTGIMSDRYASMVADNEGLFGIIRTVLTNPGYTVKQIFNTTDNKPQKLIYFLQLMLPLAFIPFITKVPVRLVLVLPVLLNLLTDYGYQYDITFQYGFAIMSLLLYVSVVNAGDMEKKKLRFVSVVASGLAVMTFCMLIVPRFMGEVNEYKDKAEMFESIEETLDTIDKDAKIAASTFFIAHLADRTQLYEVYYTEQTDFDYLIFDMRPEYREESLKIAMEYEAQGYVLLSCENENVFIYEKAE